MVWYGMVWYGMVWYGMVWYEGKSLSFYGTSLDVENFLKMVWYGMLWYGMIWYDMIWYGETYFETVFPNLNKYLSYRGLGQHY